MPIVAKVSSPEDPDNITIYCVCPHQLGQSVHTVLATDDEDSWSNWFDGGEYFTAHIEMIEMSQADIDKMPEFKGR